MLTIKTKTIYLCATINDRSGEVYTMISDSDMSSLSDWIVLDQKEIEFEVPDINVINSKLVVRLGEKIQEMKAVSAAAIIEVEGQIASLLALENQNV